MRRASDSDPLGASHEEIATSWVVTRIADLYDFLAFFDGLIDCLESAVIRLI